MYYNIPHYFREFNEARRDRYRYRNRYRVHVPRLVMFTKLKIHLTSKDLRTGQRYKFVYNQHNSNPIVTFKAEFVDTALDPKYGHVIIFKKMTRNNKGEPDENGSVIDPIERRLPTKNLNAYLLKN
jgi:hypothetical protein